MAGFRALDGSLILPLALIVLVFFVRPSHAFGAGNIASISRIEGQNWRHGDIEDTLLTLLMSRASNKKFSKLDVKRVYFGNWLRDYSQAVDVGTVKMVSAEAIRLLLWVLGFMSFGFGTREFEVTRDRLGCYRPEEHIDNPKDYADNLDARQYDRRLRGPVDEHRELSIDPRTGMKNYIASEDQGITTSAGLVRDLYGRSIQLARQARRNRNDNDLYEALRLLGTANHCLEDFSAHSNYVELCLIEMGEGDIFPHVGRRTQMQVRGARDRIWPLITGTFGGVDFLHSVMGELSDKTTQSEVDELEGAIADSERNRESASMIKDLLDKIPDGLLGGNKSDQVDDLQANAQAAEMENMHISPKEPEEFTQQMGEICKQIYPVLEFHDEIMRSITEAIDSIPVLPELIEQLQEQISRFVFSLIAPFVLPVIKQVKAELATGSSEVIQSSREKQHIVFSDDSSTDPTHSMISKDHFSNVLNEPAGKVASQVLKWVVPQIVECWDDDRADVDRTINRIINGVFHHPALRDSGDDGARDSRQLMFRVVESWWQEQGSRGQNDLRNKLSRDGVEQGRNHKEGVHDKGHGCGKPLTMASMGGSGSSSAAGVLGASLMSGLNSATGGSSSGYGSSGNSAVQQQISSGIGEAVGGGLLGSIVGGVVGGVGSSLLGGAFNESGDKKQSYKNEEYGQDGSYTQTYTEAAHRPGRGGGDSYGQAEYKRTDFPEGGRREEYSRFEQDGRTGTSGYGMQTSVESRPTQEGGYERTEERRYESGNQYRTETRKEGVRRSGEYYEENKKSSGRRSDDDDDDEDDYAKKERKRREKEEKKREKERRKREGYGGDDSNDDSDDDKKYKRKSGGYGGGREESSNYGRQETSGYGGRQESGGYGGHQESGGYGGREEASGDGRQEYGRQEPQGYGGRQESSGYSGRQESSGYGREESYGRQESSGYGQESGGYGREESSGYGRQESEGYGRSRRDEGEDEEYSGNRRRHHGGGGYGEEQSYGGGGGYGGGYGDRY